MKKWIGMLLVLALLLGCAACQPSSEGKTSTNTTTSPITTPTTVPITYPLTEWANDLPIMDGSTSTIPLEAGIRAALFGISLEEAETAVQHNSTYGSYNNLVNGDCDLIFTVQMSDEQISEAAAKGVELEQVPIAAEGFVFVVNAKNPVDTLTQEQLRGIYSGEITNWKEVGGNDAPIAAYQRNETSGSQNYIKIFMGDTPLMAPITEFTPSSMGALMDAVAYYDNAENAIGYSVYAYAADMYGNGDEIKFIHVDGVEPTKETMADSTYPLLSYNYIVFNKAQPADSVVRKLAEWVLTDDGQRAVKAAGYVPLRPVGEITETTLALYNAVGTGPEKPAYHVPASTWYEAKKGNSSLLQVDNYMEPLGIDGLADEELEAEINAAFTAAKQEVFSHPDAVSTSGYAECINGYLSLEVYSNDTRHNTLEVRTLLYDLVEGKQIPYSDLYFRGERYVEALNQCVLRRMQAQERWDGESMKRPFVGLEAGHDTFTLQSVVFDRHSVYTDKYVDFSVYGVYGQSVLSLPRDLTGVFDDTVTLKPILAQETAYAVNQPLFLGWNGELLDESAYVSTVATQVNERLHEIYAGLSVEYFEDYYGTSFNGAEGTDIGLYTLAERWFLARGGLFYPFGGEKILPAEYNAVYVFDMATGEEVSYTALLKDGWENEAVWYFADEETVVEGELLIVNPSYVYGLEEVTAPTTDEWRFANFTLDGDSLLLEFEQGAPNLSRLWARVPLSYLK